MFCVKIHVCIHIQIIIIWMHSKFTDIWGKKPNHAIIKLHHTLNKIAPFSYIMQDWIALLWGDLAFCTCSSEKKEIKKYINVVRNWLWKMKWTCNFNELYNTFVSFTSSCKAYHNHHIYNNIMMKNNKETLMQYSMNDMFVSLSSYNRG